MFYDVIFDERSHTRRGKVRCYFFLFFGGVDTDHLKFVTHQINLRMGKKFNMTYALGISIFEIKIFFKKSGSRRI